MQRSVIEHPRQWVGRGPLGPVAPWKIHSKLPPLVRDTVHHLDFLWSQRFGNHETSHVMHNSSYIL